MIFGNGMIGKVKKPGFRFTFDLRKRPNTTIFCGVWVYYISIIVLHNIYGPEVLSSYFTSLEFIPEFTSHFSRFQENLTKGLIIVEYPQMVALTAHVFSISNAGTMLWLVSLTCFGNIKALAFMGDTAVQKNRNQMWLPTKRAVMFLMFFSVIWAINSQILAYEIDCDRGSLNICSSQFNYYSYIFAYTVGPYVLIAINYQIIIITMMKMGPSTDESLMFQYMEVAEKEQERL